MKADKEIVPKDTKFENALFWLQSGIDFESRRIHVDMEVGEIMSSVIIRGLIKMGELSNNPIEVHLSSYGGGVYDAMAIYDAIRNSPCDVIICAHGKIMSAAFIIFLAGDIRVAMPNTTFMMHSVSYEPDRAKVKDHEIDVQEGKRINNLFLDIMSNRSKKPKNWWYRKILNQDFYFNLTQAKEHGIISDISFTRKGDLNGKKKKIVKKSKKSTKKTKKSSRKTQRRKT